MESRKKKPAKEGSLDDSNVLLDDGFTAGLKSLECLHFLVNCMKSIESERRNLWNEPSNSGKAD